MTSSRPAKTRAIDPRPERTRQAIFQAVRALSQEQEEPLAVGAVAHAAGISRTSFYAHFAAIEEVAVAMIVEDMRVSGWNDHSPDEGGFSASIAQVQGFLELVAERRQFYRCALFGSASARARDLLVNEAEAHIDRKRFPAPSGVDATAATRFIAGGSVTLVLDWLSTDNPVPARELAHLVIALMPSWYTEGDAS